MAREIRILHTADTHLGYRQYHSEVRRKDFFAAFEVVVNDAIEMQVDAVVHAGDLFDSRNPTLEDLLETMNILSRLKAAGIPFFGIVGNHESKQNTQWLDLFEEMGLAARLGKKPLMVGNAAIYGIDSVPKSKIPLFDYSGFEAPDSSSSPFSSPPPLPENCWKLLLMHQIMHPFPYAEWDCAEVLEKLPLKIDAILLGDYHKYEKIKVGDAWVTYPGSTERNSASEEEPRSYNIITLSDEGLEISRRTIPTRDFLFIPAKLDGEEKPYEQIFSAVNEHLKELPGSVVFLEISGDSGVVLSFSEIEEYLLNKGVLVPRVRDLRIKEAFPEEVLKVTFSDPDHAVANEIKRLSLNDGGLIVDEVVRNPNISRSRVDEETEGQLSKLIDAIDFKDPDFRIEIPASPVNPVNPESPASTTGFVESQEARPDNEIGPDGDIRPARETEFAGETKSVKKAEFIGETKSVEKAEFTGVIAGYSEITENLTESPEKEIELSKEEKKEPEKIGNLPEARFEPGVEASSGMKAEGKKETLPENKLAKTPDTAEKTVKAGQKKRKEKPAVLRQYNLGDYL
ncbi:exonuclease SbcCD subunit D [Methanosarcina sp. Z-7115]|uniref:DNA double-strand break repair protein Mre11 n=1 Tax=Methanosarcina baikalica TaxID=3073890 RepID=A0ABU2CZW0_9EURY|nr:exonuclease SbcCD subunit D [Methanosarcina sp. Z-7115]MDR7665237.1 exonuclease SbcCD subunit D [Methanosarcina sp. Z-7115]